jgi:hypothetical protein
MITRGQAAATIQEAGWLLLVVLLCPLAILAVGVPIALLGRLLIEIAAWL